MAASASPTPTTCANRRGDRRDTSATGLSVFCALAALLLGACGGDSGADRDGGGDGVADSGPTPDADPDQGPGYQPDRVGSISIVNNGSWFGLSATVTDRAEVPTPELLASEGECGIWVHPGPALCEPSCAGGFCTATDTCTPWPIPQDAGDISVTGLEEPLTFVFGGSWYSPTPAPTGDVYFSPGAAIQAQAPGADVAGFTLNATGVEPLAAEFPVTLELHDDVDKEITWTPADSGRIQLALLVGWHGAPYEAMLLCESGDDGSLTIPGSLITAMPRASSPMEQHFSWLVRFDRDVVSTAAGPIELFAGDMVIITQIALID